MCEEGHTPCRLTAREAAEWLGVPLALLLSWTEAGVIPAQTTPGGQTWVDLEDLRRFCEEHPVDNLSDRRNPEPSRILVVDDDDLVREVLTALLEESDIDCVVRTAESGVAACLMIPVFRPDLVVLDMVMPQLDGAELCHVLKASDQFASTRVLLVTGYPNDLGSREGLASGADDWIAKPVEPARFLEKVHVLLAACTADAVAS